MTIWKYTLDGEVNDCEMPQGARILQAHDQRNEICVWAEVDPGAKRVSRRLIVVGTGHEMPADCLKSVYVGSAHLQAGMFVFHVYDRGEVV